MKGMLFTADDGTHGRELWRTDGTASGTFLLADIEPGSKGTTLYGYVSDAKHTFFNAYDSKHGVALWVSDGTKTGTHLVKDVNPDTANSGYGAANLLGLAGNKLLFVDDDGSHGKELWVSDGTKIGTHLVKDIRPGVYPSSIGFPKVVGNKLYFTADDGTHGSYGNELWVSDGTEAGTHVAVDRNIGGAYGPGFLTDFKDKVAFEASNSPANIYVSDGTAAGTTLIQSFPIAAEASVKYITVVGDKLCFAAYGAYDGKHLGMRFGVSDGTPKGTSTFTITTVGDKYLTSVGSAVAVGKNIYFSATLTAKDASSSTTQLWVSDGTATGTHEVKAASGSSIPFLGAFFLPAGDKLFFASEIPNKSRELWVVDDHGARPFPGNIYPEFTGGNFKVMDGKLYFPNRDQAHGIELWVSDGTAKGTHIVKDVAEGSANGIDFYDYFSTPLAVVGHQLVFRATAVGQGKELWATDGTEKGTHLVDDVNTKPNRVASVSLGQDQYDASPLFGGKLLFYGYDPKHGSEIWSTDGTVKGTSRLTDTAPGGLGSKLLESQAGQYDLQKPQLIDFNGDVIFSATDRKHGFELWIAPKGDFSKEHMLADINPYVTKYPYVGSDNSLPRNFFQLGKTLYFGAYDGKNGSALWATDGTSKGTHLVVDLSSQTPIFSEPAPSGFHKLNGKVTFIGSFANDFWVSDGTTKGSHKLLDGVVTPAEVVHGKAGDKQIIFQVATDPADRGLYSTDGTLGGTKLLLKGGFLDTSSGVLINNHFLFTRSDAAHGNELWVTDGTAAGTKLLKEIFAGGAGLSNYFSSTSRAFDGKGHLYFLANDSDAPTSQLWVTDGTAKGTKLIKDGFANAYSPLIYLDGRLLFIKAGSPTANAELTSSKVDGSHATAFKGFMATNELGGANNYSTTDGRLIFERTDPVNGTELWTSDGTNKGTVRLTDTVSAGISSPENFIPIDLPKSGDTFLFNTELSSKHVRTITDFSHADDRFDLNHHVFNGLKKGELSSDAFHLGTRAADKEDRILYDKKHGNVYFDRDGANDHYDPVKFAHLEDDHGKHPKLDHTDFFVV